MERALLLRFVMAPESADDLGHPVAVVAAGQHRH